MNFAFIDRPTLSTSLSSSALMSHVNTIVLKMSSLEWLLVSILLMIFGTHFLFLDPGSYLVTQAGASCSHLPSVSGV